MRGLRLAVRTIVAYSQALRTTLAFVGVMTLVAAVSAYVGGESLQGVFELAEEIRAPRGLHEWLIWISFFSLRMVPVLGFVEVASLDRDARTEIRVRAMEGHAVVVGLGHLGRRVTRDLRRAGVDVVALVLPSDRERNEAIEELRGQGVRVVFGDATTGPALERAGVPRARVLVVTVDDDLTNATIAERARKMNPRLRIVVRTFRREVGELLRSGGAADVTLSTSEISSDLFAAAAELDVEGSAPIPSPVRVTGRLVGATPGQLEGMGLRVLARLVGDLWSPPGEEPLSEGEVILVQDLSLSGVGSRHELGLGEGA